MCLIFPHERLHRGDVLESGVKYLMRTDVMYIQRGAVPGSRSGQRATHGLDAYPESVVAAAAAVCPVMHSVVYLCHSADCVCWCGVLLVCSQGSIDVDARYVEACNVLGQAQTAEREKRLEDAVTLYRRAFKMWPDLEHNA